MEAAVYPKYAAGACPVEAPVFVLTAAACDVGMAVFVLECGSVYAACGVASVAPDLIVLEVPVARFLPS